MQKNFKNASDSDISLTEREKEILTGLSDGESYGSIADALFISVDTVRYHIRNIYQKLQVHSQSAAVSQAWRRRCAPLMYPVPSSRTIGPRRATLPRSKPLSLRGRGM